MTGAQLKQLYCNLKLSRKEAAAQFGIGIVTLWRWEQQKQLSRKQLLLVNNITGGSLKSFGG